MATQVAPAAGKGHLGATQRRDAWWAGPVATGLGLGAFIVYATFRALYNAEYEVARPDSAYLLSPFYSPLLIWPGMPSWLSPAMLILWAPAGFRTTCYYYRKAYYRAYFLDPAACAVSEARGHNYLGETHLLLFQNIHRYFLYLAIAFIVLLAIDTGRSCFRPDGTWFGISIGSLVLLANVVLLSGYTCGCHSLRHLVGGNVDCFSCVAFGQARYKAWKGVSFLNRNHMAWAWTSLFMVGFSDFYVWMVAADHWANLRIL
jgi:hypothetical protein